jgi:hypothetical protein
VSEPEDDRDRDPFGPPPTPTLVGCLHCHQEYESYLIERRLEPDVNGVPRWWWCCPTDGCDGKGFGFDILPCDRDWTDENGERMWSDDGDYDEDEWDELDHPTPDPDPDKKTDDGDIPY